MVFSIAILDGQGHLFPSPFQFWKGKDSQNKSMYNTLSNGDCCRNHWPPVLLMCPVLAVPRDFSHHVLDQHLGLKVIDDITLAVSGKLELINRSCQIQSNLRRSRHSSYILTLSVTLYLWLVGTGNSTVIPRESSDRHFAVFCTEKEAIVSVGIFAQVWEKAGIIPEHKTNEQAKRNTRKAWGLSNVFLGELTKLS